MGRFVAGQIVVVLFPFSDLSGSKKRPALVVASFPGDDCLLCQITTRGADPNAVPLNDGDYVQGSLNRPSFIRPNRLFTGSDQIIDSAVGKVSQRKLDEVITAIIALLR